MLFDLLQRLRILRPVEAFVVYWADFSLLSRHVCGQAGVPPVATFTLTTIGCRSGDLQNTPLFYFPDGEGYVIVASKGGAPRHPAWFSNLQADPHAWVRIRRRRIPVRAEIVAAQERAAVWERVAREYPPYNDYQARATPREIPVLRLRRIRS